MTYKLLSDLTHRRKPTQQRHHSQYNASLTNISPTHAQTKHPAASMRSTTRRQEQRCSTDMASEEQSTMTY